jgi:hypothetical protein
MAHWSGILAEPAPMTPHEFCERFYLSAMPRQSITFTDEEDQWLMA